MDNTNQTTTWASVLSFEGLNLEEVSEQTGVRDVLTTLNNTVNEATTEFGGMASLVGEAHEQERGVVSFSDLLNRGQNDQQITLEGLASRQEESDTPETHEVEEVPDITQNERGDEHRPMEQGETISLSELFARQSRISDLDNQSEVTLADIQTREVATYTKPDMSNLVGRGQIVEFGEEVTVATPRSGVYVEFRHTGYEEFNTNQTQARDREVANERNNQMESSNRTARAVRDIVGSLFNEDFDDMYGYDKVGKTGSGLPYIKAVLATRFSKLYDRRFRQPEEMRQLSKNRAVANTHPSVQAYIELTIKGEINGDVVVEVVDADGERIPYLEQKVAWLKSRGYSPNTWVLFLKTQYEFEEDITQLDQLKTLEFNEV